MSQWVLQQQANGHSPQVLIASLRRSGWPPAAVRALLQSTGGARPLPQPRAIDAALTAHLPGAQPRVLLQLDQPRLTVFGDLLLPEECDALVGLARPRLQRSQTVALRSGGGQATLRRTSEGMFFKRGENACCQRIEARLAALLNWPLEHSEGLQVLRYLPGTEYKPHFDYFDPLQPGTSTLLRRGGQRVATFILYLNTPQSGGATVFPDAGLEVAAVKGGAVFFSYDRPDRATGTLHGGAPVIAGEKWVATQWLRERVFR